MSGELKDIIKELSHLKDLSNSSACENQGLNRREAMKYSMGQTVAYGNAISMLINMEENQDHIANTGEMAKLNAKMLTLLKETYAMMSGILAKPQYPELNVLFIGFEGRIRALIARAEIEAGEV